MINREELLDRFGDEEFLHELWLKARRDIPERLQDLTPILTGTPEQYPADLGKRLHKLRGLVSNFLTEEPAMRSLVTCESMVNSGDTADLADTWMSFRQQLDQETGRLEQLLVEAGREL